MRGGVPRDIARNERIEHVFPTCVGVFRPRSAPDKTSSCFPHMRGGVPRDARGRQVFRAFSPHAWGCSDFWQFL